MCLCLTVADDWRIQQLKVLFWIGIAAIKYLTEFDETVAHCYGDSQELARHWHDEINHFIASYLVASLWRFPSRKWNYNRASGELRRTVLNQQSYPLVLSYIRSIVVGVRLYACLFLKVIYQNYRVFGRWATKYRGLRTSHHYIFPDIKLHFTFLRYKLRRNYSR